MRTVEHRRHSRRDVGGVHLNATGIALARRVGRTSPRFDRVITSPKPRAIETAEEMGFPVDATVPALGELPEDVGMPLDQYRPRTFEDLARLLDTSAAVHEIAHAHEALLRHELAKVPDGGSLLVISHSGIVELSAVAALPAVAARWGPPVGYLEGVRLVGDGRRWVSGEILRIPV